MMRIATPSHLSRWLCPVLLVLMLSVIVLPALTMRFHSDDLILLVEDQSLPLTQSHDQLHRPIRNVIVKLAERTIGLRPVPYRVVLFAIYLCACLLLSRLLRQLGITEPLAIAAGVFVFAFYPRNHEALFWFAAAQDPIVAVLSLACCVTFLEFRRYGRPGLLFASAALFGIALGFKETAIVLAGMILIADLIAAPPSYERLRSRKFWLPYVAFATVIVIYLIYFFHTSGLESIAGRRTGGYYGAGGAGTAALALVRETANLLLPFSASFGLRQISAFQVIVLLFEVCAAILAAILLGKSFRFLGAAMWGVVALLPTALFAHFQNSDRYLLLAAVALALVSADITSAFLSRRPLLVRTALVSCLTIYCVAGTYQLLQYRQGWRMASNEFSGLTTKLLAVRPAVAPDATVYILGITHSLHGFPVANNGLAGGLWAGGYDRSISIVSNFAGVSSGENALLSAVKRCPTQAPYPSSARRVFVVKSGDPGVLEIGGACPFEPIRADLLRRPDAWHVYQSDFPVSLPKPRI